MSSESSADPERGQGGPPLYLRAGGEPVLRAVVEEFYERVFEDVMIGFFFRQADRARLIEKELELALELLGAPTRYSGRELAAAHRPHRIMGGQFDRRRQILIETMAAHDLPEDVRAAWIAHTDAQRKLVTRDSRGECRPVET